jgi:hypothetical protein
VISPVKFAEWAVPIVHVLNRQSVKLRESNKHPVPRIEDLFAESAGGVTFSKLDLSQAYTDTIIDQKLTTINTQK